MQLPGKQFQHMTSATHQGRILLFGIDSDRAIYYCAKLDPPGETVKAYMLAPAGMYRLKQALLAKSPPFAVGARLEPLVGQNFVDREGALARDTYLAAVREKLGAVETGRYEADLVEHARVVDTIHWTPWLLVPLPNEADDTSVIEREHADGIDGLARSVYRSHKRTAVAPMQVISDGAHLHLFRQSDEGTLLVDRFALDSEASRLVRKIEVRFKRSRKRHEPLRGASVKELDSLDFRDANGDFFLEPSIELRLFGVLEAGRFAVVLTPTHELDRHRWHIFTVDGPAKLLRSTTVSRTAESLFDLRDWLAVEGDPDDPIYRQIPGVIRQAVALHGPEGCLEARVGISAIVHDLQRELAGDDGESHYIKVERRVLVAVPAGPDGKVAALSFGLHRDGSLAPVDPTHTDQLLLERTEDIDLPANTLDRLETCRDDHREPPPSAIRYGLVFDGDAQRIDVGVAPALAEASFTIEFWAKRTAGSGRTSLLVGQGDPARDRGLHIGFRDHTKLLFGFWNNDLEGPPEQDLEWHHWACVYQVGGLRQIYRDGLVIAEDRPPQSYLGKGPLTLGGAFDHGFPGTLADVRVWRRARTAAEIQATMSHRLTGRELGLVAHWPLDAIVDGRVFNTVGQTAGLVVGAVHRSGRPLARKLADGQLLVDRYSNPALVPVAERATYVESFELKSASGGPPFDVVFWGETVRGERTAPARVAGQFETLPDGWVRVTARFTTQPGMTRLRTLEFTPGGGTWNPLEIRKHRLMRLRSTVTESSHAAAASLTELAPEFAGLMQVEQTLDSLEAQEQGLAEQLRAVEALLVGEPNAAVAQKEQAANLADARGRQFGAELQDLEGHVGHLGTIALRTSHSTFSGYLRVDGDQVDVRASEPGPWELFLIWSTAGRARVHYGDDVALYGHTGRFLTSDGVRVTTTTEPGANWWIFNPDDPADQGPIPFGAQLALMSRGGCLTYDTDPGSHTHGVAWGGGAPAWENTRFCAEWQGGGEAPEVTAARDRHNAALASLDHRNQELAFARELLANYQDIQRRRDDLVARLVAVNTQISGEITNHLTATRAIDDRAMSMPKVSALAADPLTVQGALLGFARTHASPTAIDSLTGAVNLYFIGTEGRLRRCTYDAVDQRWRADLLGACLRFDGGGAHVEIPHRTAFINKAFTIELWVRWRGTGSDIHFLTGRGIEELEIHTGGAVPDGLRFIPVPGVHVDSESGVLRKGRWVHVACVYAGHASTAEIYLDGKNVTLTRAGGEGTQQKLSDRPLRLGLRGDGSFPLAGEMAEVRLWNIALTGDEIAAQMHLRLSGHEPGLVGCWPLREGAGANASDLAARDLPPAARDGAIKGPLWYPSTAPIGRPAAGLPTNSGAPLVGEYGTLAGDDREAILRRFVAWPRNGGAEVLFGQRVDSLELRWLGNVQSKPTLVGYIEGAPPVPSENLTIKDDYNGASSVEFKVTNESTYSFTHDVVAEANVTAEAAWGVQVGFLDLGEKREVDKLSTTIGGHIVHQSSYTEAASVITSERLALKGSFEAVARLPQLGRRFIPKNVGYASVVSSLADMFVMRMRGSKRMVGFQISPVKNVPPDVNVITFMLNPAYTMNGSLDGQIGTSAADPRLYGHIPDARGQYGSAIPASYYRLAEAYALKTAIDRANSRAAALAINRRSDLIPSVGQGASGNETLGADKEKKLADAVGRTPMSNIVNTYVWDGDGGLRSESQSLATSWTNVLGGGWSFEIMVGHESVNNFIATLELSLMASFSIRHTMTTTNVGSRAIELNVTVDGENQGITDNRDRPIVPGEKVDRYRFMSFALEPATAHFIDFFAQVVDPEWLAGTSEEAYALRQIDRLKPNETWRVLHRITYVERPK
ncbi:LamG domain-containing protein [Nannocystis sp.]|uniref:LamG domain-containing protein n=1 Tax=Nannocystis sp. TaxID=1962667 RepID=UPI0025E84E62|nr:LamG domain-containing protein [Nannocystis sp.]MBK7827372.1 LamG domain-containing protein [Nannocystis sp.]